MWKLIEQYLIDHRTEIDLDEPSDNLWNKIEAQLPTETKTRKMWNWNSFRHWQVAAAIILLLGVGLGGYWRYMQSQHLSMISLTTSLLDWDQYESYPELSKIDSAYSAEAGQILRKINSFDLDSYSFIEPYRKDLYKLDKKFKNLRKELHLKGNNEQIQGEIASMYKEKLNLLEDLLQMLEQVEKKQP